ncbi:NAD-dependent epimerase/dehydratase family protein [Thalassobaculum sp.]|uniref:NAD-dependent epimerase/dehydratase family protein n=1 Tax=Thalassobaculum sp. TaxID=2022740 RepID=UPI003B5C0FEB
MLDHRLAKPALPPCTVVLGAGFVGGAAADAIEAAGGRVERIGRAQTDLLAEGADEFLAEQLRPDDVLVVTCAETPCEDGESLVRNIAMMNTVIAALKRQPVAHVIYVSSDAVYKDRAEPLTEADCAEPGSLHGIMHLARERLLLEAGGPPLGILRPVPAYGAKDPHNAYGPNRFRRLALDGRDITLVGEGEERRDHVLVEDLGELIRRMVMHRSTGVLNAATGEVHSYREVAEMVASRIRLRIMIKGTARPDGMAYAASRSFNPSATFHAFPDFRYTSLAEGLAKVHRQVTAG